MQLYYSVVRFWLPTWDAGVYGLGLGLAGLLGWLHELDIVMEEGNMRESIEERIEGLEEEGL